ncbi:MAG: RNA-binding domain-containing protein [Nitrososphaerota archaeon]|nr:RNA-binding domain-containing protein [Nitrososphaerota archaeon]
MKIQPFPHQVKLKIHLVVNPSEDVEKLKEAVVKIMGNITLNLSNDGRTLQGESDDQRHLYILYEQIRARQTMGVVRRLLIKNSSEECTWLYFNRQAAYVGVVSICEEERESPLGPIRLDICTPKLSEFIDWLAPV